MITLTRVQLVYSSNYPSSAGVSKRFCQMATYYPSTVGQALTRGTDHDKWRSKANLRGIFKRAQQSYRAVPCRPTGLKWVSKGSSFWWSNEKAQWCVERGKENMPTGTRNSVRASESLAARTKRQGRACPGAVQSAWLWKGTLKVRWWLECGNKYTSKRKVNIHQKERWKLKIGGLENKTTAEKKERTQWTCK